MMQSVQVIIERLKTNPEDFFVDTEYSHRIPKFQDVTEKLDDLLTEKATGYVHRLWYLEPEEKEALLAAYKEARRARFEAGIFHALLTNEENRNDALTYKSQTRRHPITGKALMQPAMWQGAVPKEEGAQIVDSTTPKTLSQLQQLINQQLRNEVDKADAKSSNT
jgi:hypothetical protein